MVSDSVLLMMSSLIREVRHSHYADFLGERLCLLLRIALVGLVLVLLQPGIALANDPFDLVMLSVCDGLGDYR